VEAGAGAEAGVEAGAGAIIIIKFTPHNLNINFN
jgi:hypothetical protein